MCHAFSGTTVIVIALSAVTCGNILHFSPPASAASPPERIALMLTGSHCRKAQQSVETALRNTDGVFAVDGTSVPGHLLVDVMGEKTSAHDILTVVHTTIAVHLSCQVEVMQSCITATRPGVHVTAR